MFYIVETVDVCQWKDCKWLEVKMLVYLWATGWCQDHAMVDDGCFGGQFLVLTTISKLTNSNPRLFSP
ncbi:hypothetical protein Bca52824_040489 [Brassica carinata]|uniref:Uncharacterized protein n=1 Tax=Brassica carinata TaxID=52824 RepID=A0A8X7UVI9_BRACI|nr:hypothetical protein Bca52824_040489 [Brassica carinata]